MLNLSPLFYTTDENEACLYTALDLGMRPRNYIAEAKTDVRNCLRVGIPRVLKSNGYASSLSDFLGARAVYDIIILLRAPGSSHVQVYRR